jgi:hypothetical protein
MKERAVTDLARGAARQPLRLVLHLEGEIDDGALRVRLDADGMAACFGRPTHRGDVDPQCVNLRGGHSKSVTVRRVDAHHARREGLPMGELCCQQYREDGVDDHDDFAALALGVLDERDYLQVDRHGLD